MSTPESPAQLQVLTGFATDITATTATLSGMLTSSGGGGFSYEFNYGTTTSYGSPTKASYGGPGAAPPQVVTCQISGLTPGTAYHFRLQGASSWQAFPGADVTFVTAPGPPAVTPGTPVNVTSTTATLTGTVNPCGLQTHYLFGYGLDTHYQSGDTGDLPLASATGAQPVSRPISGLTPGTTYHVMLHANNSAGSVSSADFTFTTHPAAPVVTTSAPTGIGMNNATLHGTVNPMGVPATYYWEYGPTVSYGMKAPVSDASAGSGTTAQPVTYTMPGGLLAGTAYHCRIVATSSAGTTYGNDVTFTSALPSSPGR